MTNGTDEFSEPVTHDRRMCCVLMIAGLMSLLYAAELLVDLARPKVDGSAPAVGLFSPLKPTLPRVLFWSVASGWAVALLVGIAVIVQRAAVRDPLALNHRVRTMQMVALAALLLPFTSAPLWVIAQNMKALLVCLPGTAFALWAAHRMQRYRRMPFRIPLATFGWGVLIAYGFGGSMNLWYMDYAPAYIQEAKNILEFAHKFNTGLSFHAAAFEELGKGAGVAIVCILFRHHVDGVVSGIVLGAAAGLGFNLVESVQYMSGPGAVPEFHYWMRQSVGLMAAHTAFAAIAGAGFGLARQLHDARSRGIAIVCGFLAAAGTHAASNVIFGWISQLKQGIAPDPDLDVLLLQPVTLLIVQGPVVALYLMLLRHGLRDQAAGIAQALAAEVKSGSGAITDTEASALLNPAQRLWLKITVLRRYGFTAYRKLTALHAAQLDLAIHLWHQFRQQTDRWAPSEQTLRHRILELKGDSFGPSVQQRPAEALA